MTEQDFMLPILLNPADDVPRLVLADWFEENGQYARAEFIRLQINSHGKRCLGLPMPECDWNGPQICPVCRSLKRAEELHLATKPGEWSHFPESLHGHPSHATWNFLRGFVHSIRLTTADFMRHARALFSAQPIEVVELSDKRPFNNMDNQNQYGWSKGQISPHGFHYWIPTPIFDEMRGKGRIGVNRQRQRMRWFLSERAATDALSQACIAYAKKWQQTAIPQLAFI